MNLVKNRSKTLKLKKENCIKKKKERKIDQNKNENCNNFIFNAKMITNKSK